MKFVFSEIGYMMHVDHHRFKISLVCNQCNLVYKTVCMFYNHACQRKKQPFCVICSGYESKEAKTYFIQVQRVLENESNTDIKALAKSIDELMYEIVNFKGSMHKSVQNASTNSQGKAFNIIESCLETEVFDISDEEE